MSDYDFIIDNMTWSFSRLESFDQCPLAWKMKYIDCEHGEGNAFSSYGSFVHGLLEQYLKGNIMPLELAFLYENGFDEAVPEDFPPNKYVDMRESYFYKGLEYFENFEDVLDEEYEVLGVEKEVRFEIDGNEFVGFIDLLAKDLDGKIIVVDHKSASLKWTKTGRISKQSAQKMESYKRQLYLYCKALIDDGIQPDYLCWNFFNDKRLYKILFDPTEYEDALQWATETIDRIRATEEFEHHEDWYFCHNICDMRNLCEYCVWEKPDAEEEGDKWYGN